MPCPVDTRLAPHVGLCRPIRPPKDLILHLPSARCVDPKTGTVYGAAGTPVGATCAKGYVRIGMTRDGHQYAHRLIYEATLGPIPAGHHVDHKNGCKSDNRIANLEAVTPSENLLRAFERSARGIGEQTSHSKLTPELVRQIRCTTGKVACREWLSVSRLIPPPLGPHVTAQPGATFPCGVDCLQGHAGAGRSKTPGGEQWRSTPLRRRGS